MRKEDIMREAISLADNNVRLYLLTDDSHADVGLRTDPLNLIRLVPA